MNQKPVRVHHGSSSAFLSPRNGSLQELPQETGPFYPGLYGTRHQAPIPLTGNYAHYRYYPTQFQCTLTGQLYRASMELFFIELGITPSLLLTRQNAVDCLTTPSLVKLTMIFLAQHNILLKHSIRMLPPCTNDQFIMEALLDTNVTG